MITMLPHAKGRGRTIRFIARLLAWIAFVVIAAVTVSPLRDRPQVVASANLERAVAFIALGFLFGAAYRRHWQMALCFIVCAAVGLELAQLFAIDRDPRFVDAIVKAIAGAIGVAVGHRAAETVHRGQRTDL